MDDDIEVDSGSVYRQERMRKELAKRKPTTFEAVAAAMLVIKELLAQEPKPDLITLMVAASEHVDTMGGEVRLTLREFIVDNGGSLAVDANRIRNLIEAHTLDSTWTGKLPDGKPCWSIQHEEPNADSLAFNNEAMQQTTTRNGITFARCRFPVGFFRPFNQGDNLCCGRRFNIDDPALAGPHEKLARQYCPTHRDRALRRGTAANKAPANVPPAQRANLAARKGRSSGFAHYDS